MHPILTKRSAGILTPIFSLPSEEGVGDFNACLNYLDFLSSTGLRYWQILPLNATDKHKSPYASFSLDSMNLDFISTRLLMKQGLIKACYAPTKGVSKLSFLIDNVDFVKVQTSHDFQDFYKKNIGWLMDLVYFRSIMDYENSENMYSWNKEILFRNKYFLNKFVRNHEKEIMKYILLEYLAHSQWKMVKEKAHQKNIKIIGDLAFYPGASSVEIWTSPQYFLLDENKEAKYISGVPGDSFDPDGQIWNSPVYNWENIKKDKYMFLEKRITRALEKYDFLRLDHFRGYEKFYMIPKGKKAVEGHWVEGPGDDFLEICHDYREALLAEDLGSLDKDFYSFKSRSRLPGMGMLVFEEPNNRVDFHRIFYTSNHDTMPLGDYVNSLNREEKEKWSYFLQDTVSKETLLQYALSREENLCIFQHSDLLERPNLRINTPGTTVGNWKMQLKVEDQSDKIAQYIKEKLIEVNRYNE